MSNVCTRLAVEFYFEKLVGKSMDDILMRSRHDPSSIDRTEEDCFEDFFKAVAQHVNNTYGLEKTPALRRQNLNSIRACIADINAMHGPDMEVSRAINIIYQQVRSNSHRFIEEIRMLSRD